MGGACASSMLTQGCLCSFQVATRIATHVSLLELHAGNMKLLQLRLVSQPGLIKLLN
jgi:hypothetical protein